MPFLTRTALIYTIGIQYVGLHSMFTSLLSVLSFAELGIGSALVFAMYKPIADCDDEKVCALLAFYRKCYAIIGCSILAIGIALLPFLDALIDGAVPEDVDIRLLFGIYLTNTVIGYFTFAHKQALFVACQRVDITSKVVATTSIVSGCLQIILLVAFLDYYLFAAILPAITLTNNVVIGLLSRRAFPQYSCNGCLERTELRDIVKNVAGLVFVKVGSVVLTASDTLVISAFLGLWVLGVYNGYAVTATAAAGVIQVVQSSLIPTIGNKIALDSREECHRTFNLLNFMYMWLAVVLFACLMGLMQPFVEIWQGSENTLPIEIPIAVCLAFFVQRSGEMSWMFREAAGLWWQGRMIPFLSSIINLGLNLAAVQFVGLIGVVVSTIFALLAINLPLGAYVLFKQYFQEAAYVKRYLVETCGYLLLGCAIGAVAMLACDAISVAGIPGLCLRLVICILISNMALLAVFFRTRRFWDVVLFFGDGVPQRIRNFAVTHRNRPAKRREYKEGQG